MLAASETTDLNFLQLSLG